MMTGSLGGRTILRYAHIFRHRCSGGAERYLENLNRTLLERNDLTIVQMHLVQAADWAVPLEEQRCGIGRLIWVPVALRRVDRSLAGLVSRFRILAADGGYGAGRGPERHVLRVAWRLVMNRFGHLRYPFVVLSERLAGFLDSHRVDLLCLHWMSYDVGPIIRTALKARLPYVVINHFDNDRLRAPKYRRWLAHASGIGGVSSLGVPAWLKADFVNLGDATNTQTFDPARAKPVERPPGALVLLPARIIEGKGHLDLLQCARLLLDRGREVSVAFAGLVDSQGLLEELHSTIGALGLEGRVSFLGELREPELRDWYAASDVVVLPSYSEGLSRVLLEAQAMEKPVVAYAIGGTPEALLSGRTGYLVRAGDLESLAGRLDSLLLRPAEGTAMGRAGRAFVKDTFSTAGLTSRHERFYLDALQSAGVNPHGKAGQR